MFDSYVLTLFYKVYYKLHSWYSKSVLRKIELRFRSFMKRLSQGSVVLKSLSNDKSLIEDSLIYKLYGRFLREIKNLSLKSRRFIENYSRDSFISSSLTSLFRDKSETVKTISIFFLFFSSPLFIITAVKNSLNTESMIFLVIALFSAILLIVSTKVSSAIANSKIVNFINRIVTIDEEEDSWI